MFTLLIQCLEKQFSKADWSPSWSPSVYKEHWDDPEGWDGEGGGRGVQDGEHT